MGCNDGNQHNIARSECNGALRSYRNGDRYNACNCCDCIRNQMDEKAEKASMGTFKEAEILINWTLWHLLY
ncbi:MAG: hypothetical protein FWC15_04580 [Fibromonadales bacterium]|nr:hypothetical protein [Fibromonadales bacterium]